MGAACSGESCWQIKVRTPGKRSAPTASAAPAPLANTLDFTSLGTRLRETKAIGVLTKLSVKNQADDLLETIEQFVRRRRFGSVIRVTIDEKMPERVRGILSENLELGETDRAIQELEIGAKLAPDSPQMLFHLARAYQRAGRKADADRIRAEFIRLDRAARAQKTTMTGQGALGEAPPDPQEPPRD